MKLNLKEKSFVNLLMETPDGAGNPKVPGEATEPQEQKEPLDPRPAWGIKNNEKKYNFLNSNHKKNEKSDSALLMIDTTNF